MYSGSALSPKPSAARGAGGRSMTQELLARAAAEAVAAAAEHPPLVVDGDVVPVGEAPADHLIRRPVVVAKDAQRLIREDDAEAERVVGAVALVHRHVGLGPRLLRQQ